jgi:DinB family protein
MEPNTFDLAGILERAAAIEDELIHLAVGLTESQFHAPGRHGSWSVGFCMEHLILAGDALLPGLDAAVLGLPAGPDSGARSAYNWWRRKLIQLVEDPSQLKRVAPPALIPYTRRSIGDTVAHFRAMHRALVDGVARASRLDLRGVKLPSPVVPWMRHPVEYSFDLTLAHERRHLAQARNTWLNLRNNGHTV